MRIPAPKPPKGFRWLRPNENARPTDFYHSEDTGNWYRFTSFNSIYAYHYAIRKLKK